METEISISSSKAENGVDKIIKALQKLEREYKNMGDIDVSKQIKKLRQEFYKSEKGINNAKKLLENVTTLLTSKGNDKFAKELKKTFENANQEIKETEKNIKKIDPKKLAINNLKQLGKEAKSTGDLNLYKRIKGFESTLNFDSKGEKLTDITSRIKYLEQELRNVYGNTIADKFSEQVAKDPNEVISPELEKQLALQEEQRKKEEEKIQALKKEQEIRKVISQNMKDISSISKQSGNKELSDMAKIFGQNVSMTLGQKEAISNQEIMIQKVQETRKLVEELGVDYLKAFDESVTTKVSNSLSEEADSLAQKELFNLNVEREKNRILEEENQNTKEQVGLFARLKETVKSFKGCISSIKEINTNLDVTEDEVENINEDVKEQELAWQKIGGTIKTVFSITAIKIFFQKISQGIQAIYKGLTAVVETGGALLETQNLFEVAMGENIEKAETFQSVMHEAFGTNLEETKRYQAYFSQMSTSLGIATDEAYTLSQGLTKLGMDISSLYNISQESAMQKLRAGLAGQTKSLRDVGLDITQQSLAPIAQEFGITRSVKNLSQAEKILLRYITVLKQAESAHGDLAKTIEQPANQLKVLQNQLKELARAISNVFLPIVKSVLPYINGFLMALKEIINMLAIAVGYTNDLSTSVAINDTELDLGLEDDLKQAKELNKTLGIDELNVLSQNDNESNGIGSIDPALLSAIEDYENGMEKIRMKALDIRDAIMEWLGYIQVFDEEGNRIGWELGEGYTNLEKIRDILIAIGTIILGIHLYKFVVSIISGIKNLWTLISSISILGISLKSILGIILGIITVIAGIYLIFSGLKDVFEDNKLDLKDLLKIFGGILLVIVGITIVFGLIPGLIAGVVASAVVLLSSIIYYWDALVVSVKNKWIEVKTGFMFGIETIKMALSTVGTNIIYFFKIKFKEIIASTKALLLDVILFIAKKAEDSINGIIGMFKNIASLIDKIFGTDFAGKFKEIDITTKLEETVESIKGKDQSEISDLKSERQAELDAIKSYWEAQTTLMVSEAEKEKNDNLLDLYDKMQEKENAKIKKEEEKAKEENTNALKELTTTFSGMSDILKDEKSDNNKETSEKLDVAKILEGMPKESDFDVDNNLANMNATLQEDKDIAVNELETLGDIEDGILDTNTIFDETTKSTSSQLTEMTNTIVNAIKNVERACENIKINVTNVVSGGSGSSSSSTSSGSSGKSLLSKITSAFKNIKGYATGGMPESGDMFYANENGIPELVGKIGGKTAVVNNEQIVQAVSSGVASAVQRVFASQSERPINVSLQVDSREIARANNNGQQKLGHKIVGGAFAKG